VAVAEVAAEVAELVTEARASHGQAHLNATDGGRAARGALAAVCGGRVAGLASPRVDGVRAVVPPESAGLDGVVSMGWLWLNGWVRIDIGAFAGMKRICEPELMDDPLQARVYSEADFSIDDAAFTAEVLALRAETASSALEEKILDLGCGPGNISFRLAAALPAVPLLGLDGAAAMVELAERRRQASPERWPRLTFARARLPLPAGGLRDLPAAFAPPYSLLVSNSFLHHLHDPAVLWRAVARWGAPGALVMVRDLRRPESPEALREQVERHAGNAPAVLRRDYAASLAAAFRPEEVEAQLAAAGLEDLRVSPRDDRYLDVSGRLPA